MELYKYLRKEYAENMLNKGEVYVGTLSYYRKIEDDSRADRLEGTKTTVTKITETKTITNKEEWERELPHFIGSNINYVKGNVVVQPGEHKGNDDVEDCYIYCMSQNYDKELMNKFGAESCIEIFNVQYFLQLIHNELVKIGLIYQNAPSSGKAIDYIGHELPYGMNISGNWLKRDVYKDEAEFRFCFIPIVRIQGKIVQPTIDKENTVHLPRNIDALEIKPISIRLNPLEIAKCCRVK